MDVAERSYGNAQFLQLSLQESNRLHERQVGLKYDIKRNVRNIFCL